MSLYPKAYLYRRIVHAKLFMDRHFAQAINLNEIADEAAFSKFHFIRLFRQTYGKTPHQYLTAIRLEQAKLLLKGPATVSEVCHAVGFDSLSSFTGLFKRRVGFTPSAFQRSQRQRQADMHRQPIKFVPGCFAATRGWTDNRNFQEGQGV